MPPSESLFLELGQSVSWRGKLQRPQSWRRVCATAPCMKLLSGVTLQPSTAARLMAVWMESLAVSPAPISALPAAKPGSTETPADCSSSTCESFAKFSPDGSLLKTSRQFSLFQQEEPYSENLPRSGSMRNGELYERPMLAPRIDGTGRSSWPTPVANDDNKTPEGHLAMKQRMGQRDGSNSNRTAITSLQVIVQDWRTPNTRDHHEGGPRLDHPQRQFTIADQVRQWATPNCRDDHNPSTPESARTQRKLEQGWTIDLNEQAAWWTTPQAHDSSGGNPERVGRFGTKHGGANFADDVTLWRTPNAAVIEAKSTVIKLTGRTPSDPQVGLPDQVNMWKTPDVPNGGRTMSAEGPAGMRRDNPDLNVIACHSFHPAQPTPTPTPGSESSPSAPTSRRRLNPSFVDWLMGLPPGWTAYAPAETASWYSRVRMRLESLLKGRG